MNNKTNQLNFEGQMFFIGIDTHKRSWTVTIRSNGMCLKTFSMEPSPKQLYSHLCNKYPGGTYCSVYEAGYSGYWIHRELAQLGVKNIIVNPADVPSTNKEKDRKNDPIDSSKLSRELNNGSLNGIHVPDPYQESIRVLSRLLNQHTRRGIQIKNRIKALLCFLGMDDQIDVRQRWSAAHITALSKMKFKQQLNEFSMKQYLADLEHVRMQRMAVLKEMRKIAKGNEIIKLLRTIPGIGTITSFTMYAELITMDRFKSINELASIVGLVPSTASSDKKVTIKGMSKRHSRYLRYSLIEAAWIAVRADPVFTLCFNKLCKRMTKQRAIIKMSKKLLNRVRSVWKNKQSYVVGTIETEIVKTNNESIAA